MKSTWYKSSFSGGADNCVETRRTATGDVEVRHSKDPHGRVLGFTPAEWEAFIGGAKAGEFNL